MVESDSAPRPRPEELTQKPRWIPLEEMLPPGSIGETLLSTIPNLGRRKRPETIFNQPVSFPPFPSRHAMAELQNRGLDTVGKVLRLDEGDFSSLMEGERIQEFLRRYLEELSISPHVRLLSRIVERTPESVSPESEEKLKDLVERYLPKLNPRETRVLALHFGLIDGITRSYNEIGKEFSGLTQTRIGQIENIALWRLRHPTRLERFKRGLRRNQRISD